MNTAAFLDLLSWLFGWKSASGPAGRPGEVVGQAALAGGAAAQAVVPGAEQGVVYLSGTAEGQIHA